MQKNIFNIFILLLMVLYITPVEAQFWGAKKPRTIDTPKDSLKKGEFTWAPELSPKGPILVTVSLDEQLAYTYRNGILIGVSTTSTGKSGHETPTGFFHTIMKDAKHHSSKYNNASMPFTQKFTADGVALHAGGLPGYPSSHGCVHLPSEYARLLFKETPMGMTVVVTNKKKSPEFLNHPAFLSPVTGDGKLQPHERLSATETYRWAPEKSTEGPVTLLMSRTDQRLVVTRNGIEIGRAKIAITNPLDSIGTNVFLAQAITPDPTKQNPNSDPAIKWLAQPLADANYGSNNHGDAAQQFSRVKIPDAFVKVLQPVLSEGTTLIITDAAILRKTTGKTMAVLSSHPGL
jgi:hypothetical protein